MSAIDLVGSHSATQNASNADEEKMPEPDGRGACTAYNQWQRALWANTL